MSLEHIWPMQNLMFEKLAITRLSLPTIDSWKEKRRGAIFFLPGQIIHRSRAIKTSCRALIYQVKVVDFILWGVQAAKSSPNILG